MMKSIIYLTIIPLLFYSTFSTPTGDNDANSKDAKDNERLLLSILKHQPCTSKPTASERIRFSAIDNAPLEADTKKGPGCYLIGGTASVRKEIKGTVQAYVAQRSGIKAPREKCTGADQANCGGVGSCVYCDICSDKDLEKTSRGLVHVEQGGKSLDCANGIKEGNYTDIKISFCTMTRKQFKEAEGIDDDILNQNGEQGHSFFLTMYLFNKAINTLSSAELEKIAHDDSSEVIGCHRIVGNVYSRQE